MPRHKVEWSDPVPVSVEIGGTTYQGTCRTGGGRISVSYSFASKEAQLLGSARAPRGLAALILSELVAEMPKT